MNHYWYADAHSCLPLHGDTDINQLRLHYDAGVRYLSVNVGMDMNPLTQIMTTIAGYRRQIAEADWLELADTAADIERIAASGKLALSFDLEGALPLLETPDMVALYHRLG
ncbi:MAG: dipeptidase, partial [Cardiobacterium sp.]